MKRFIYFTLMLLTGLVLSCTSCKKDVIVPDGYTTTIEQGTNTDDSYIAIQGGTFTVVNPTYSFAPGLITFEKVYDKKNSYSSVVIKAKVYDKVTKKFLTDEIIMYSGTYTAGQELTQLKATFPTSFSPGTNKFYIYFELPY